MKPFFILFVLFLNIKALAKVSNESEIGIASANGNTRTQTYNIRQMNDYGWDSNLINFKLRYLNAYAQSKETARFFSAALRYERQLSNRFGIFFGETLEKDRFANIDNRYFTDIAGRYRFIDTEIHKISSELGYRYMHEKRTDETYAFSNYGRIFTEWDRKWDSSFSTKVWAEYLPNFTEQTDWLFNTEASLVSIMNSVFSLKVGILLRYDHMPAPNVEYKTDTLFTTALVAAF